MGSDITVAMVSDINHSTDWNVWGSSSIIYLTIESIKGSAKTNEIRLTANRCGV